MKRLSSEDWLKAVRKRAGNRKYNAMYSSWVDGIVTEVELMMLPIDEHMVHRGDGIFEAITFHGDFFFEMDAHIDRLFRSADMIGLKINQDKDQIKKICNEVAKAADLPNGLIRIFVGRGPGDFSPNPYSTVGSQLYVVAMPDNPTPKDFYKKGVKVIVSKVPVKPFPYAQIKSCNYLQNVMTKKEALDRSADFAIGLTEKGEVTEGATENLMVLTAGNELVCPPFDYTLKGTTLMRVLELAKALQAELDLRYVGPKILEVKDLVAAKEIMMVGTTLGVCPVTSFEGKPVGDGMVGPVSIRLQAELLPIMTGKK